MHRVLFALVAAGFGRLAVVGGHGAPRLPPRGGGPMGRPRRTSGVLDASEALLDAVMGLLNAGRDPFDRLMGLLEPLVGRGDVVTDPNGQRPTWASHLRIALAFHGALPSADQSPPGAWPAMSAWLPA
jgi:hypothetical protein